jgi:hypothetical protein
VNPMRILRRFGRITLPKTTSFSMKMNIDHRIAKYEKPF